jgi:hypothetical protein
MRSKEYAGACEIFMRGDWTKIDLEQALRLDASRTKRCIGCHGEVKAHKPGKDGQRAHFEHKHRHKGCQFGDCFDGEMSPHPKALR